MEEFFINADGRNLHAKLERPDGKEKCPVMIIVHGLTGNMDEPHLERAAACAVRCGYAALRVEMYGHGKSEGSFAYHNILNWIDCMVHVIDYAKKLEFADGLYLMGHSQGGLLTFMIGGIYPDLLKAIIPLSPGIEILAAARAGRFVGIEMDPKHVPDEFDLWGFPLKGSYVRTARLLHLEDAVNNYHGPVRIIQGLQDLLINPDAVQKAAAGYDNCKITFLDQADHCYRGHLDEFAEALEAILLELKNC